MMTDQFKAVPVQHGGVGMLELVRRCNHCASDMTNRVSAESYLENPYCNGCLNARLDIANEKLGPTRWERSGHYVKLVKPRRCQ